MPETELSDSVARAVRLLRASRAPVVAGLGADVAGIVAAFALARKLGAAIDHAGAEWALRDQAVLQDIGLMLVSPGEARRRADTLLLVGDGRLDAGFDGADRKTDRKIVALTPRAVEPSAGSAAAWLKADANAVPGVLAALRARVNNRPLAADFAQAAEVKRAAELLKAAAFGVALWSPAAVDTLTIEMLTGLIKDLNGATRWTGLSVTPDASLSAAAMASGWMAALPLRASFAHDRPKHDPWQFDAQRMVQSGEADAILWISAFDDPLPDWLAGVPAIVVSAGSVAAASAAIGLRVGRPGRDHDAVLYDRATGTLAEAIASAPAGLPSAAEVLRRIAAGLDAP